MKLKTGRTLLVGLAFMSISGFWQLYDFITPLILTNTFNISDTLSGIVMSLDNILALFLLPLFGTLSDKYESKFGKRMPFIIGGTFATVLGLMVIPYSVSKTNLTMFVIGLLFVLLSLSTYRSPAVALMPDVTPKPLRSKGNAIINFMGAVGGAIVLASFGFLSPDNFNNNHFPIFIAMSLFMTICILIMIVFVKENRWHREMVQDSQSYDELEQFETHNGTLLPEVKRSLFFILISISLWFMGYNAVVSAFSRYAVNELGLLQNQAAAILMVATVGAIVSYIPIGFISTKFGRKKTILLGITLLFLAFSTAFLYKSGFSPLMYVNFAVAGFAWAAINVNSLPMVLEIAKGSDVGKYTGLYYTFSMSAQIITPILSGILFDFINYKVLFPYASFFVLASGITMLMVKHGDVLKQ